MKTRSRFVSFFLCLVFCLSLFAVPAFASGETPNYSQYDYILFDVSTNDVDTFVELLLTQPTKPLVLTGTASYNTFSLMSSNNFTDYNNYDGKKPSIPMVFFRDCNLTFTSDCVWFAQKYFMDDNSSLDGSLYGKYSRFHVELISGNYRLRNGSMDAIVGGGHYAISSSGTYLYDPDGSILDPSALGTFVDDYYVFDYTSDSYNPSHYNLNFLSSENYYQYGNPSPVPAESSDSSGSVSIASVLSNLGSVFLSVLSWAGMVGGLLATTPVLTFCCVALPLCSIAVGFFMRLRRSRG